MKLSIPQILKEKKKSLVTTIAVVTIAGFSFVAGKKVGGSPDSPADSHGQKAPTSEGGRKPASEPKKPAPKEEDHELEREVDEEEIQIAHHRDAPVRAKHGKEKSAKHADTAAKEEHATSDHAIDHRQVKEAIDHRQVKEKSAAGHSTAESKQGFFGRLVHTYTGALHSIHDKVVRLHRSEEENRNLRIENAHLRVRLETQKFDCRISEAKAHAEKVGSKLNAQTGTRTGRFLASIQYQMPENLLPEQLHALGVSYMKAQDYERAAAILTFLTELEEDATFKKPENFLMAGIAWYKLENFKNADQFFERTLKDPTSSPRVKTQAKIWKAIVAQRSRNYAEAQEWLRNTLESDPQSKEAHWVNPQEGVRKPASKEAAPAHEKDEHETRH